MMPFGELCLTQDCATVDIAPWKAWNSVSLEGLYRVEEVSADSHLFESKAYYPEGVT